MLSGGSAFLLGTVENRARRGPLMYINERARPIAFKLIRGAFPCPGRQWSEGMGDAALIEGGL